MAAIRETAEALGELDPVRNYPERGAEQIAQLAGAGTYVVVLDAVDGGRPTRLVGATDPGDQRATLTIPLRAGRAARGVMHLYRAANPFSDEEVERLRWAGRLYARGLDFASRLAAEGARRPGEAVAQTLERAPLTPRERDVVTLLVSGSSTRDIAAQTSLTISTVNTYLKRIFAKLGVHSRVELVARMAGTDVLADHRVDGEVAARPGRVCS